MHKLGRKAAALGFILTILFGNIWILRLVFQQSVEPWIRFPFLGGVGLALTGGALMVLHRLMTALFPEDPDQY